MKILRNSLIVLSCLLVATALAAPGFVGPKVEETWKQQLGRLQGGSMGEYRRGWFGAETSTEVQGPEGSTRLHSDIQHGPLLFTAGGPRIGAVYSETRLSPEHLGPNLRKQLEQYYGRLDHSPLVLETLVGADNRVINTLRLEAFTRSDSKGELIFDGGEIRVETDYSGRQLRGSLKLGRIQQTRNGLEVLFTEPASGDFHYTPGEGGEASIQLSLLRAEADSGPMELFDSNLKLKLRQLPGGLLELVGDLDLPKVQSATPITSIQQRTTLPQISLADLSHYIYTIPNWDIALQRPLQMQQQWSVQSHNGPVLVDADIDWRGGKPVSGDLNSWLRPLHGNATLNAAEQALLQSPLVGQAIVLRDYGLLLEKDGELQMNLRVTGGDLQVNGEELPADLLLLALTGNF